MEKTLINVIATDLDGTLLSADHSLGKYAYDLIQEAKKSGIRVMIVTGRDYLSTKAALGDYELDCDYIVASGAEVRDSRGNILKSIPMDKNDFPKIMSILQKEDVFVRFCATGIDYFIGSEEQARHQVASEVKLFFGQENLVEEDALVEKWLSVVGTRMHCIDSLETLMNMDVQIFKVFIAAKDQKIIARLTQVVAQVDGIAAASSFPKNLELTNVAAQKGPVLKEYLQKLGYSMQEVMVLGDSMNDYSMLSMDYGATVAMGDGMDAVKQVAKYVTKSNAEHGAEYAIQAAILNHMGKLDDLSEMLRSE